MTVLYLSQNGISDHIGQSQVAPYLLGLAAQGYDIHLLTAEKPGKEALKAEYAARFAAAGIRWTTIAYHNRPPLLGSAWDLAQFAWAARRIVRAERITVVHCRSHPPMPVGMLVKRRTRAKLLFDFRDFWADSNLAHGRFRSVFRWFKRREADYVASADAVVTLTRAAAEHLARAYPDPNQPPGRKYTVIPCCADFDLFRPLPARDRARADLRIPGDTTVLVYLGSIGPVYLVDEMMALFAELCALRPGAVFLLICNNGEREIASAAAARGIPADRLRVLNASRPAIPSYLAAADVAVAFKRADLSNLGCSPVKIGEFLACGVPVIANAGVGDLDDLLEPAINGSLTLADFAPATMQAALARVLGPDRLCAEDIRANSAGWRLEEGVSRYASIYEALGERPGRRG